jgi:UDP-N-acetylglucosamine 2-epimerase (non-hydrolysing)
MPDSRLDADTPIVARGDGVRAGKSSSDRAAVLSLFGTRPEVIKLAPVIRALEQSKRGFRTVTVSSGQHASLLYPFVQGLGLRLDHDLKVMTPGQTPSDVLARVLTALDPVLESERPDLILVQGDTTTALAGALAGFHRQIPVGHVEAGLRSGDPFSPFPEEMNRRLISRLATYHFAATAWNKATLIQEGVNPDQIVVTGNPGIDSLHALLAADRVSPVLVDLLEKTFTLKRLVLTTHRRESFGPVLAANLRVLRSFVDAHADVGLLFPVHPNPSVRGPAQSILGEHPRIWLLDPLGHADFVGLMARAWLLVSDSGGVQEEAPTLKKPLIVLRENTERPEAVDAGVARLAGNSPDRLRELLAEAYDSEQWTQQIEHVRNPFGAGDAGARIARAIEERLPAPSTLPPP